MVTRDLIKEEIDKVQDQYLDTLYKIIRSLMNPQEAQDNSEWFAFVEQTYGSFASDPILRETQGQYEIRESLE